MKPRENLFENEKLLLVPALKQMFAILILAAVVIFLGIGSVKAADSESAGEWQFMAEAYFWYASMGGESADGGDIQVDDNDLIDALDFGFMGNVGAKKDKWAFLVDAIYINVSDDANTMVGNVGVNVNVDVTNWVVTPMIGYEVYREGKSHVNILAGARYLSLSADIDLRNADPNATPFSQSVSDSGSNWDAIVGLKGDLFLNDNWFIPYYLDIGTGNSQFTWQASAGVGYRFDMCDVLVAYRYLGWNFDDDDVFDNLNISGFGAGVRFFF